MTVAIFGHGPLGCLLAMAAAQRGARAVIVGKGGWRLDHVRRMGLGECLDGPALGDVVGHLRSLTGGRGADVTVDATGRPEVWEQAMAAVGRGGTVVFFGGCAPGTTVTVDTRRAHYEELALVGAFHHTPVLIRQAVSQSAKAWRSSVKAPKARTDSSARSGGTATNSSVAPMSMPALSGWKMTGWVWTFFFER